MRSLGIVQLGTVVLGPLPSVVVPVDPAEQKERERVSRVHAWREEWELQFGHTGACPYSDEQIEQILTGRVRA